MPGHSQRNVGPGRLLTSAATQPQDWAMAQVVYRWDKGQENLESLADPGYICVEGQQERPLFGAERPKPLVH